MILTAANSQPTRAERVAKELLLHTGTNWIWENKMDAMGNDDHK